MPELELVVREPTIPFVGEPGESSSGAGRSQASIELAGLINDTMLLPDAMAKRLTSARGIAQSVQEMSRFLEVRTRTPLVVRCSMIGIVPDHTLESCRT